MGRRLYVERGSYPVDARGFAVPVWDTDVPYVEDDKETNHHYNFYAHMFGRLAIAQTFRNLPTQQLMMPDRSHTILHQMYTGIKLPEPALMLDAIEEAQFNGDKLKIRYPHLGYQSEDITDDHMTLLYDEYNNL